MMIDEIQPCNARGVPETGNLLTADLKVLLLLESIGPKKNDDAMRRGTFDSHPFSSLDHCLLLLFCYYYCYRIMFHNYATLS